MQNLYDLTRPRLAEWLAERGFAAVHAARLWRYLYRQDAPHVAAMRELPPRLIDYLEREATLAPLPVHSQAVSGDGLTHKFLLELADRQRIETVLMQFDRRATACLSSQAGCALGCVFCATGRQGLDRNLTTGEIVQQALHVRRALRAQGRNAADLRNVVLMGMGEPLLNYDAVIGAIDVLREPTGLAIGGKQITLSTVGIVPGIVRLADERQPFSLAVSLHAATQERRAALLPIARVWPLDALLEACRYYVTRLERRIFFEWTLIAGENDSADDAHAVARLLAGLPAQVNLIPLNPIRGYAAAPSAAAAVGRFVEILAEHGLRSSVRQRRGIDIDAGCGQLAVSAAPFATPARLPAGA